ncbi:MAG: hypothetical protein UY76_C0046G0006 [Candidatus Uhrbacteria bacterium GW2011_GWA2_52_8d]|uniref:Uncharacterized protein n=1 Tax=Candidatus Uhrbacteria bacterium GW2011_GWA2_52_8d TaxID=1618979 RepID=A0A0G1ZUA6_9BACT|nr:MAG: hypothetical protein UY76_C0046G0006 [Candidatus Uhrbacteria bacterium GW2011_GWA2_52_8d]
MNKKTEKFGKMRRFSKILHSYPQFQHFVYAGVVKIWLIGAVKQKADLNVSRETKSPTLVGDFVVDLRGFEPLTSAMRMRRSTN